MGDVSSVSFVLTQSTPVRFGVFVGTPPALVQNRVQCVPVTYTIPLRVQTASSIRPITRSLSLLRQATMAEHPAHDH